MRRTVGRHALILAAFAVVTTIAGAAQGPRVYTAWPAYGGGPEQIRYSSLAQIDRSNVAQLQVAWTYDSGETGGLQTNPIVVGGRLFTTTPKHKVVSLVGTVIVRVERSTKWPGSLEPLTSINC